MIKLVRYCFFLLVFTTVAKANVIKLNITLEPLGKFEAKSNFMSGGFVYSKSSITSKKLTVKVEDLKTEISLRDWLFHKHLNIKNHPTIVMTNIMAANGSGSGNLTVNGISKNVLFNYKEIEGDKLEAKFFVKPSDFNLRGSTFLFIKVVDLVEVTATIPK